MWKVLLSLVALSGISAFLIFSPVPGVFLWGKARKLCVSKVEQRLDLPASAYFPRFMDLGRAFPERKVALRYFVWNAYVDSDDHFGMRERREFQCGIDTYTGLTHLELSNPPPRFPALR